VAQAFGVETEALCCRDGTGVLVPKRAIRQTAEANNAIENVAICVD